MSAKAESRMGAVTWAMRQRSVSHPRSSNRTCRSPASGSPTGFIVRHTEKSCGRKRLLYAISPALFDKLNFNFLHDIAPVGGITRVPNVVSVAPSLPVETIPQLIAHAKANPGKLNFGAPTAGT